MNKKEAALILGVAESASAEEIKAAHRRLMRINHPDTGGSPLLSTKINEAKEYLERENVGSSRRRHGSSTDQ